MKGPLGDGWPELGTSEQLEELVPFLTPILFLWWKGRCDESVQGNV